MSHSLHPNIPDEVHRILNEGFFAYLSSAEPGCQPHITTMFYLWDEKEEKVYLITNEKTKKLKNIKTNPNIAITVDERDPDSPAGNRGVLLRGKARVISIPEMGDIILNRYLSKYLDFLGYGFPMGSRVAIEVVPKIIHYWKGIKFQKWMSPKKSSSKLEAGE
ncbi:MAG: pyridoxamine 5'-phosphate oxidase family protein [Candidatus Thorarchaeota archaeon]